MGDQLSFIFPERIEVPESTGGTLADDLVAEIVRVRLAREAGRKVGLQRARIADRHGVKPKTRDMRVYRWAIGAGMLAPIDKVDRVVRDALEGKFQANSACYCCGGDDTESHNAGFWVTGYTVKLCDLCSGLTVRRRVLPAKRILELCTDCFALVGRCEKRRVLVPTEMTIDLCSSCSGLAAHEKGSFWRFVCPEHGPIEDLAIYHDRVKWAQHTVKSTAGDLVGIAVLC